MFLRLGRLLGAIVLCLFMLRSVAHAGITMRVVSDAELVNSPVIVVGYWQKEKRVFYSQSPAPSEVQTHLVITSVLKGDVKTGVNRLICNYGSWWEDSGLGLQSGTSTEVLSEDVFDVRKPAVWFLSWERSADRQDKVPRLCLRSYCYVHSTRLLPLYKILCTKERDERVGECFKSKDPLVLRHTLEYVAGYRPPWPFGNHELGWQRPDSTPRVPIQIPNLRAIIDGRKDNYRAWSAALYAEMAPDMARLLMPTLLNDRQEDVRLVAAGWLVRLKATQYSGQIASACSSVASSGVLDRDYYFIHPACEVIKEMGLSAEGRYAPAIMSFLESDKSGGSIGEDNYAPSLYARDALRNLTCITFPLNVIASRTAWKAVPLGTDSGSRNAKLIDLLGEWDQPFTVSIKRDDTVRGYKQMPGHLWARVVVTNTSKHSIVMAKIPTGVGAIWGSGGSFGTSLNPGLEYDRRTGKQKPLSFVEMIPGRSIAFPLRLPKEMFGLSNRSVVTLEYMPERKGVGRGAWMGVLHADLHTMH